MRYLYTIIGELRRDYLPGGPASDTLAPTYPAIGEDGEKAQLLKQFRGVGSIVISVTDTGAGLSEEQLESTFWGRCAVQRWQATGGWRQRVGAVHHEGTGGATRRAHLGVL